MKKENRIIALILAALLFTTILFSYVFVIEHVKHDCTGENCPICLEIEAALQTISSVKSLPMVPLLLAVFCVFAQLCIVLYKFDSTKNTLITLKVELLD